MKRFTKPTIDWKKLESLVGPEQRAKFLAFKGKADGYLRRVLAAPAEPPKIDWEAYKKIVPVEGLVDKLKSEYESFKVPTPTDTMSAEVDKQWQALQPEIQSFCEDRQKVIDDAKVQLDKLNAIPHFEEITMEMLYDMYPDKALDPVNRPTFWPHWPDEQEGYVPPVVTEQKKK